MRYSRISLHISWLLCTIFFALWSPTADHHAAAKYHYTDYVQLYPHVFSYQGPPNKRIALTFDDGPDQRYTPQILSILRKKGVHATFFVLGKNVKRYPNITRQITKEGHILGNHSYNHPSLTRVNHDQLLWEVKATEREITQLTGKRTRFVRPPYGNLDPTVLMSLGKMGYHVVNWSVDSNDWRSLTKAQVLANIIPHVRPGSIILQHCASGGPQENLSGTVAALPSIIDTLRQKGYQFVTIQELFATDIKTVHAPTRMQLSLHH
ncbi:MAG: polysaccharide deacetylase family protein [Acidibacillus sp.]|nr:polysaccharide deacetylase family protein [Acidibacillus sp.]